jgi:hypothetical protein
LHFVAQFVRPRKLFMRTLGNLVSEDGHLWLVASKFLST